MSGPEEAEAEAHDLARAARTLAQAHPLTALATNYVNGAVAEQKASQPMKEIDTWVSAALLDGYSLRRVEENRAGLVLQLQEDVAVDPAKLGEEAGRIAAGLRAGDDDGFLIDGVVVVEALDRIIGSQISRRLDNVGNALDQAGRTEVEEYITWWVVQGYAVRAAEQASGVVA